MRSPNLKSRTPQTRDVAERWNIILAVIKPTAKLFLAVVDRFPIVHRKQKNWFGSYCVGFRLFCLLFEAIFSVNKLNITDFIILLTNQILIFFIYINRIAREMPKRRQTLTKSQLWWLCLPIRGLFRKFASWVYPTSCPIPVTWYYSVLISFLSAFWVAGSYVGRIFTLPKCAKIHLVLLFESFKGLLRIELRSFCRKLHFD